MFRRPLQFLRFKSHALKPLRSIQNRRVTNFVTTTHRNVAFTATAAVIGAGGVLLGCHVGLDAFSEVRILRRAYAEAPEFDYRELYLRLKQDCKSTVARKPADGAVEAFLMQTTNGILNKLSHTATVGDIRMDSINLPSNPRDEDRMAVTVVAQALPHGTVLQRLN